MYAIFVIVFTTEISDVMTLIFFAVSMEIKLDADDKLLLTRLQTCSTAWRHIIDSFWSLQSQNEYQSILSQDSKGIFPLLSLLWMYQQTKVSVV